MGFVEILPQSLLRPFLIDEVYESTVLVALENIVVVLLHHITVESVVVRYRDFWTPFEIGTLIPDERHRPSELDMGIDVSFPIELSLDNTLSLCSIGSISIEIRPSNDPSLALSPSVSPCNQSHIKG